MNSYPYRPYGVRDEIFDLSVRALETLRPQFEAIDSIKERNQLRVIAALRHSDLTESSLAGSSGYAYDDRGREAIEEAFAEYFECEAALVRHQFSSGTHVLATCLRAILRPDDEVLIASGDVYDTIRPQFGLDYEAGMPDRGSLRDFAVTVKQVELDAEDQLDLKAIMASITPRTKLIYIQKSRGYSARRTLSNAGIAALTHELGKLPSKPWVFVDNCYCEFVEEAEVSKFGVDLCAGSLIKNPGAGIAPTGGYVCGRQELVDLVAQQLTAVGVGGHIGATHGISRDIARGFYFAPQVTANAVKGAIHTAALLELCGFELSPASDEMRSDIVQRIVLKSPKRLIAFCKAIQAASPVDARYAPIPAPMPGYDCDIIMASGSFIQGSSIELSCDGPLREPYAAYQQGGLSFEQCRLASMLALQAVLDLDRNEVGIEH